MGSTPVASGSSVPACPTRCAPVRRRRRLTTANDVSPAGLSTLRIPVLKVGTLAFGRGCKDRLLGGRQHHLHGLFHRPLDLRAGGPYVAAASERSAHRRGIDGAAAADADLRQ